MESPGAGGGRTTADEVISKLKDDGDFDALRLKIVRKLKENEVINLGHQNSTAVILAGHFSYQLSTKSSVDKENGPRTVNDLKLINAGRILENNIALGECTSPTCDFSGVTTMHVVIRPPSSEKGIEKKAASQPKVNKCGCVVL